MGKRGPTPKLTERDMQILEHLYMARCMTGTQLQRSVFGSESRYARQRLKVLRERGLIQSKAYTPTQNDKTRSFEINFTEMVYELTDLGVWEYEKATGEWVVSRPEGFAGSADRIKVATGAVSRYLQAAEVYLQNKQQVDWMPHFVLRHRLNARDFTVASLAAVKVGQKIGLLYGVADKPSLKAFGLITHHSKDASSLGITTNILMCPNQQTVNMAVDYFQGKSIEGDLYVLTYQEAQEELPFIMQSGFNDLLMQEVRSIYAEHPVLTPTGRHPAEFDVMVEHRPGKFSYVVDLSTGHLNKLFALSKYDEFAANQDRKFNNSLRGVWVLIRNEKQFETIKPYLPNHHHVRITLRSSLGSWYEFLLGKWNAVEMEKGVMTG